jgi:HK97 family phage portal protein
MKFRDRLRTAFKAFGDTMGMTAGTMGGWPSTGYATSADWFFASWPNQNCIVPNPVGTVPASSLVAAACNFLGTTLSASPVEVYERNGDEWQIVRDHPMSELLEEPNPYYSGELLWKTFAFYWLTTGNVYLWKARNASGKVVELWLLQSERVAVYSDDNKFISHYAYRPPVGAAMQEIAPEDMIHFRYSLNPRDHRLGISPLASLSAEISTDIQGEIYSCTALSNYGVPPYVLSPKLQQQDLYLTVDVDDLKRQVEARSTGQNRGKPLVFARPIDIKEFGYSPQQMSTKELRRIPEERISSALGMPAIVLGFGCGLDHATYANYETALRAYWYNNCIPTQKQIAATLEQHLLNEFEANSEDFDVQFDNSDVDALKENANEKNARETSLWINGIKKRSEVRSAFDLDTTPDDDHFYVEPMNEPPPPNETPPVPRQMAPDIRPTVRGPRLRTITVPTTEKAYVGSPEPSEGELEELDAWWAKVAPPDAEGVLDAHPRP